MKRNRVSLVLSCLFPLLFLAIFLSIVKSVLAETRTVGSPACPTTIQACINISRAGDTVFIPAGTYVESLVLNTAWLLVRLGSIPVWTPGRTVTYWASAGRSGRALTAVPTKGNIHPRP